MFLHVGRVRVHVVRLGRCGGAVLEAGRRSLAGGLHVQRLDELLVLRVELDDEHVRRGQLVQLRVRNE